MEAQDVVDGFVNTSCMKYSKRDMMVRVRTRWGESGEMKSRVRDEKINAYFGL